jgi:YbbR domain-containing protein
MTRRVFAVPEEIAYSSAPSGVNIGNVAPEFTEVTVIGPEDVLNSLTADDIMLSADVSKIKAGQTGSVTVPVTCVNNDTYWIYGSYMASAEIG